MKNYLVVGVSLLFLVMVLGFCKKNEPDSGTREWGEATALVNGIDWQYVCFTRLSAKYNNKFSQGFTYYNSEYYRRNSFNFRNVPYAVGKYIPF